MGGRAIYFWISAVLAFVATLAVWQIPSVAPAAAAQTAPSDGLMTVTLYSPAKYMLTNASPLPNGKDRPDLSRAYFSFASGRVASPRKWDLSYGTFYGGEPSDWFVVGLGIGDDRSAIKDLGRVGWNDKFRVPVVPPLPDLKPGEPRYITTSGKGPARGLPSDIRGTPSARDRDIDVPPNIGVPTKDRDINQLDLQQSSSPPRSAMRKGETGNGETSITIGPKNSKRSKPASVVARVLPGHLYVIHVVKAQADFYVLAHVDGLVPADNCTISWKRIPAP